MKKTDNELKKAKSFDELLDLKYGEIGTSNREVFEQKANLFVISEMMKFSRKEANITQQQLADKTGTKKNDISKLENGIFDVQLSTLYKVFEIGLGKQVQVLIK